MHFFLFFPFSLQISTLYIIILLSILNGKMQKNNNKSRETEIKDRG